MTNDTTGAGIFVSYLLEQLKHYGVDTSDVMIQTDNGSEYIGCVGRKRGRTAFVKVMDEFDVEYIHIPPGVKTHRADVEIFHRLI